MLNMNVEKKNREDIFDIFKRTLFSEGTKAQNNSVPYLEGILRKFRFDRKRLDTKHHHKIGHEKNMIDEGQLKSLILQQKENENENYQEKYGRVHVRK